MSKFVKCDHERDEMCMCISRMNTAQQLVFIAGNIRDVSWELDYATLAEPVEIRLCIVGICEKCGSRLCYGLFVGSETPVEKWVESVYTYITLFHKLEGQQMDARELDEKFLRLFHEQDRPAVTAWMKKRCGE